MFEIIEKALGITVLILLILFIIRLIKNKKIFNKTMNNLEKNNPHFKEKIQIFKSKRKGYVKTEVFNSSTIKYYISILIIIILLCYLLFGDLKNQLNSKFILGLIFLCVIFIFILLKRSLKATEIDVIKYTQKLINNKYGYFTEHQPPYNKIIYKTKSDPGNIRNVCNFSYFVDKYNCIFENHCHEELTRNYINDYYSYNYVKIKNFFKYYYDLEKLKISNITPKILSNEKVIKKINELSNIKQIKVSIENKYLLIEKETVLAGYNKNDVECNVCDIELFYNSLIKTISEVK